MKISVRLLAAMFSGSSTECGVFDPFSIQVSNRSQQNESNEGTE